MSINFSNFDEETCRSCVSMINLGRVGHSFDLSQEMIQYLLDRFNIKIQKTPTAYICFHGIKVGDSQTAPSSGEAFCLFLKSQGCELAPENVPSSLQIFCEQKFI